MSLRMRLRLLIDDLSEEKLQEVEIYIEALNDPVLMSMITAPYDDEPLTDEEREAVEEGRKEAAEGRLISNEELWQSLGL